MEPREFHWPVSLGYSLVAHCMEPGYRDQARRMQVADTAKTLVDLGGGDGRLAVTLARTYPGLRHVVSVDISRDMTRRALRRMARAGLSSIVSAACHDMHALPYDDGRFDAVVSFGALHHARQPERFLAEAYRVLRPGGCMSVIDGYGRPAFGTVREAVRRFGGSGVAALAYWCGSKDVLRADGISGIVAGAGLPDVELAFDGLLAIIRCVKRPDST